MQPINFLIIIFSAHLMANSILNSSMFYHYLLHETTSDRLCSRIIFTVNLVLEHHEIDGVFCNMVASCVCSMYVIFYRLVKICVAFRCTRVTKEIVSGHTVRFLDKWCRDNSSRARVNSSRRQTRSRPWQLWLPKSIFFQKPVKV